MNLKEKYDTDIRFYYFTLLTGQIYRHFLSDKITLDIETSVSQECYSNSAYYHEDERHFKLTVKEGYIILYSSDNLTMSELGIASLHPLDLIYASAIYEKLSALDSENMKHVLWSYKTCFADSYTIDNYINYIKRENVPKIFIFNKSYFLDNYTAVIEIKRFSHYGEPVTLCCWVVLYNKLMQRVVTGYSEEEFSTVTDINDFENRWWKLLLDKCEKNFDYITYNQLSVDIRNRNLDLIIMDL